MLAKLGSYLITNIAKDRTFLPSYAISKCQDLAWTSGLKCFKPLSIDQIMDMFPNFMAP